MSEETTTPKEIRGARKSLQGTVVSDAMERTIVVQVERNSAHSLYKKIIKIRKKYAVHDQENQAKVGDRVEIMGTRPLSKTKRWRLVRIIEEAPRG